MCKQENNNHSNFEIKDKNTKTTIYIKDIAENYYKKPIKDLENAISNEEIVWGEPIGKEIW